ncbi:DUF3870 domain-containing protein [Brevibacillus sp. NRS-1366]|uniref:DUF3870 domain-containing protein n=1 Tax=Brevibacillus sp. NRS-1366 TaxID=3233899 RepID=UPI003D21D27D
MNEINTVLVSGYAKAPQGTSMYEVYKHAGLVLEINIDTHIIENIEFTFVAELSNDFIKRIAIGYDLSQGIKPLLERIRKHLITPSQQAVIVALQTAVQRYTDYTEN